MKFTILFNKDSHFVSAGSGFAIRTGFKFPPSQMPNSLKIAKNEKYV